MYYPPAQAVSIFSHPDFALMCARSGLRAGSISWFYVSTDRCHSWQGPYRLPMFGMTGISARTDYLVNGADSCMFFLTASKADGEEGRVFLAETTDGGSNFRLVSTVGPEPSGFEIMPAGLRLSDSRLVGGRTLQGRWRGFCRGTSFN